jgi:hypothetical protein
VIGSYMDESFDQQPKGVFAVGGILGRGTPIFELERRWEKLLKRPDIDVKYFKANDCYAGVGEFEKFVSDTKNKTQAEKDKLNSIHKEFLNAIVSPLYDDSHLVLGGVGIVQADFYEVIQDAKAKAVLGSDPYRLAYDFAMIQCAWAMKELGTGDAVSFICDEQEEYGPLAHEAFRRLKDENPNAAKYLGTYTSADDKDCIALQAADAVIFEIRRALNLSLKEWEGPLREQFNILTQPSGSMFLITHTTKDQLHHIVSTHEPGEPFKLDSIMEMQIANNVAIKL